MGPASGRGSRCEVELDVRRVDGRDAFDLDVVLVEGASLGEEQGADGVARRGSPASVRSGPPPRGACGAPRAPVVDGAEEFVEGAVLEVDRVDPREQVQRDPGRVQGQIVGPASLRTPRSRTSSWKTRPSWSRRRAETTLATASSRRPPRLSVKPPKLQMLCWIGRSWTKVPLPCTRRTRPSPARTSMAARTVPRVVPNIVDELGLRRDRVADPEVAVQDQPAQVPADVDVQRRVVGGPRQHGLSYVIYSSRHAIYRRYEVKTRRSRCEGLDGGRGAFADAEHRGSARTIPAWPDIPTAPTGRPESSMPSARPSDATAEPWAPSARTTSPPW